MGNYAYEYRQNWGVASLNGLDWVHYENYGSSSRGFNLTHVFWHLPLTDEHLLTLKFERHTHYPKKSNLESAFDKLIEQVIKTVRVGYSTDAQRQKAEVENQYPNEKISESLPELVWEEKPVEDEWAIRERLIESDACPIKGERFNPDGSENMELSNARSDWRDKMVAAELKAQQEALDAAIQKTLASHLDFSSTKVKEKE